MNKLFLIISAVILFTPLLAGATDSLGEKYGLETNDNGMIPVSQLTKAFAKTILDGNDCHSFATAHERLLSASEETVAKGAACMESLLVIKSHSEVYSLVSGSPGCWEERVFPSKRLIHKCAVLESPKVVDGGLVSPSYRIVLMNDRNDW